MNIEARPTGIPDCGMVWSAIDSDTYDGAEDSSNRHMVGYGATKQEAIDDLLRLMREEAEWKEDEASR